MIQIVSVQNNLDGVSVTVNLATVPTGTLVINASRTVGIVGGSTTVTQITPTQYSARIENSEPVSVPTAYSITATDETGTSNFVPIWLRFGTDEAFTDEVAAALSSILLDYKPWIDLYLAGSSSIENPIKTQVITSQSLDANKKWPAIAIAVSGYTEEWYALPVMKLIKVRVAIECVFNHNTPVSYINIIKAMGQAVHDTLNQLQFNEIALPSGLLLEACTVQDLAADEYMDGSNYLAVANLNWYGECAWATP